MDAIAILFFSLSNVYQRNVLVVIASSNQDVDTTISYFCH